MRSSSPTINRPSVPSTMPASKTSVPRASTDTRPSTWSEGEEMPEAAERYLVAGCKPWSRSVFDSVLRHYPGEWHFILDRQELTIDSVAALDPRYIFFLHWSWKVPDQL